MGVVLASATFPFKESVLFGNSTFSVPNEPQQTTDGPSWLWAGRGDLVGWEPGARLMHKQRGRSRLGRREGTQDCREQEATLCRPGQSPGGLHASPWQREVRSRPDWPRRRAQGPLGEHVPAAAPPVWTWRARCGPQGGGGLLLPFSSPVSRPTAGPGLGRPRASLFSWQAPGGRAWRRWRCARCRHRRAAAIPPCRCCLPSATRASRLTTTMATGRRRKMWTKMLMTQRPRWRAWEEWSYRGAPGKPEIQAPQVSLDPTKYLRLATRYPPVFPLKRQRWPLQPQALLLLAQSLGPVLTHDYRFFHRSWSLFLSVWWLLQSSSPGKYT